MSSLIKAKNITYNNSIQYKRGDVFLADLSLAAGSEQSGIRPIVIISNDIGNRYSSVVITCSLTTKVKTRMPTHVDVKLKQQSIAMLEQIRTLDKFRLINKVDQINEEDMKKIDVAIAVSFGLNIGNY